MLYTIYNMKILCSVYTSISISFTEFTSVSLFYIRFGVCTPIISTSIHCSTFARISKYTWHCNEFIYIYIYPFVSQIYSNPTINYSTFYKTNTIFNSKKHICVCVPLYKLCSNEHGYYKI